MHEYFSKEQLRQLTQKVEADHVALKALIDEKGETGIVELDQSRMGRLARIDAIQRQEMAKMNQNRMKRDLQELFLAMKRLELVPDEFGYCENCDEPIPFGRLMLRPMARSCVPCLVEPTE